ncbi:hypothetical protein FI667_g10663, partial [Globisporangium splendens]
MQNMDVSAVSRCSEFGMAVSPLQHSPMGASCASFTSRENCVMPKSDEYQQPTAVAARPDTESRRCQFELFDFDTSRIAFGRSTRSPSNSSNGSSLFGSPTTSSTGARSTSSAGEGYDSTSSSRDVSPFGSPSLSFPLFRFAFPAPTSPVPKPSALYERGAVTTPSASLPNVLQTRRIHMTSNVDSFDAPSRWPFDLVTPALTSPKFNSRAPSSLACFSSSATNNDVGANPRDQKDAGKIPSVPSRTVE